MLEADTSFKEAEEIASPMLNAATAAILESRGYTASVKPLGDAVTQAMRYAEAALEAAGVPKMLAERDRLAKANAGSWSLYQECATANEGLAAENRQLLARIAELEGNAQCRWTPDNDGIYQTECENAFVFDSGTPSENGVAFCGYCGKRLVGSAGGE